MVEYNKSDMFAEYTRNLKASTIVSTHSQDLTKTLTQTHYLFFMIKKQNLSQKQICSSILKQKKKHIENKEK